MGFSAAFNTEIGRIKNQRGVRLLGIRDAFRSRRMRHAIRGVGLISCDSAERVDLSPRYETHGFLASVSAIAFILANPSSN